MREKDGIRVNASTAITVPANYALPAIDTILREFVKQPGNAALALNMREMHLPFEALISVPIEARVSAGENVNEWRVVIRAASRAEMYPVFSGCLTLISAAQMGSQIELCGMYTVPLGRLGRAIDLTILRGVAQATLQRFVRELGNRVHALAHWAQVI